MEFQINNDGVHQSMNIAIRQLDTFSYNMIDELPNSFIKCVYHATESSCCQYGLNGKRSLQRYITQRISIVQMLKIIYQIAEQLLLLCDYLIDIRQVYLSEQTIFVDLLTDDVRLLLIPDQQYDDFPTFKQWLLAHIETHRISLYSTIEGRELYDYVSSDEFCLSGLKTFIKDLESRRQKKNKNFDKNTQKSVTIVSKSINNYQTDNKHTLLSYLPLVVLQLVFVVGYVLTYLLVPRLTADLFAARLGSLMIALSIDIIVTRALMRYLEIEFSSLGQWYSALKKVSKKEKVPPKSAETTVLALAGRSAQLLDLVADKCYSLDLALTLIGRQNSADIRLNSRTIGRRHCQISHSGKGYQIEDLASVNGTYINDRRLTSGSAWPLKNGDKLRIADRELIFIDD